MKRYPMKLSHKIVLLTNKFKVTRSDIASFVGVSDRAIFYWQKGHKAHRIFENKIDELLHLKEQEACHENK